MEHHHHHDHFLHTLQALDVFSLLGLVTVFSYSFLLSLHCVGMCGPLACSVTAGKDRRSLWNSLLYNGGRLTSYVSFGVLFGWLSAGLLEISLELGTVLAIASGVGLILYALSPLLPRWNLRMRSKSLEALRAHLFTYLNRLSGWQRSLGLGLLTIFLPCMTLHPLLLATTGLQSPMAGGLIMAAFFLGTLPAMLATTLLPQTLFLWVRSKQQGLWTQVSFVLGRGLILFAGVVTIWRVFGHH
jgi:sulfite exporter TauE/SafE